MSVSECECEYACVSCIGNTMCCVQSHAALCSLYYMTLYGFTIQLLVRGNWWMAYVGTSWCVMVARCTLS